MSKQRSVRRKTTGCPVVGTIAAIAAFSFVVGSTLSPENSFFVSSIAFLCSVAYFAASRFYQLAKPQPRLEQSPASSVSSVAPRSL
jgi:hypothetical protein